MKITPLDAWIAKKIGAGVPVTRTELDAWQLTQLNSTIRNARSRSRFYRGLLAEHTDPLTEPADLKSLPFTTAADLTAHWDEMLSVSQSEVNRIVTLDTSGTQSTPKRLYFSLADQELTIDFFHHGMGTFAQPGEKVMIFLPHQTPGSVGDLLAIGLERLGVQPFRYGPVTDPLDAWHALIENGITGAVAAPKHMLALARLPGVDQTRMTLRWLLLSTDHLPRALAQTIESTWHCQVFDHYGMTETGLGGAVMCQAGVGMHPREADLLFEIIDTTSGEPLPEGETGEIVVTTLTRNAMPLIRYRTGDLGRMLGEPCPCGSQLKRLDRVTRRLDGGFSLNSDLLYLSQLDEVLFALPGVIDFSTVIEGGEEPGASVLRLELVHFAGSQVDLQGASQAVKSLPVISTAINAGTLRLRVTSRCYNLDQASSMAKRKIIDSRRGT